MKALVLSPTQNMSKVIMRYLLARGKDYSSNLVVFPGKRPSHFLRKAIAEKERSSFLPPCTFSMDEFIDHIYKEELGYKKRKLEPIDAVALLYDIHKNSPNPLGQKWFLDPDTFFPLGLTIYSDLEELYLEGISPSTVREIDHLASETIPEPTAQRLQSLSHFYETFYQKIDEGNYSTRSSRYREVSLKVERVNLSSFNRIIFAGFFGLTRPEREIFNSLKSKEEVIFLFQDGLGLDTARLGIHGQAVGITGKPLVHVFKSPDTHGQVLGLANLLKDMREKGEKLNEDTVIVLPSAETLFPLYHHVLPLLPPGEYNISLGYPLQRTPLFGLFTTLMQLILSLDKDRFYIPYYLEFILHPYIKNIYCEGQAEITRIVFHTIEEVLTEKKSTKFMSLAEIERNEAIFHLIKERMSNVEPSITLERIQNHLTTIHENTIRKLLSCQNVGEFASKLKEVIEFIYQQSTARLHPFFYPYAETFVTQLHLISRSLIGEFRFEETGSYCNLIKKVLAHAYTPFTGTPLKGLQILGFLETRTIQFKKVFFLDVNEGVIPERTKDETLLPIKVRQMLGLPTYLEREKLTSYYFDTLIKGAREVYLFYVENAEKERSRLVEKLLWERQKEEKKADDKSYLKAIQYSVNLQSPKPRPLMKSAEIVRFLESYSYNASSLDTYLSCPLAFYYEHVLRLREKEKVSEETEREEIGLLVHQILFDYFKGKTGRTLSPKDMDIKELEQVIHNRFEEQYGRDLTGNLYLLRRQVEKHLKDFITRYQIPKIKNTSIRIVNLEHRLAVVRNSFHLTARMDRIEKRNGRTVIVDYKTSAAKPYLSINFKKLDPEKRESWNEAIGTIQLPFYLMVYAQSTGQRPQEIDCSFLLLGRNRIDTSIELPLFEERNAFDQHFGLTSHVIFTLLHEIINPQVPFLPAPDHEHKCEGCLYRHFC